MKQEQTDNIAVEDVDMVEGEGADELYEHFAITVDKGQKLLRLDKFLVDRMEHCSRYQPNFANCLCSFPVFVTFW